MTCWFDILLILIGAVPQKETFLWIIKSDFDHNWIYEIIKIGQQFCLTFLCWPWNFCDKNQQAKSSHSTMKLDQLQKFDNLPKHASYSIRTQNSHLWYANVKKLSNALCLLFVSPFQNKQWDKFLVFITWVCWWWWQTTLNSQEKSYQNSEI